MRARAERRSQPYSPDLIRILQTFILLNLLILLTMARCSQLLACLIACVVINQVVGKGEYHTLFVKFTHVSVYNCYVYDEH